MEWLKNQFILSTDEQIQTVSYNDGMKSVYALPTVSLN